MGKVQKSQKAEEKMKRRPVTKPARRRVAQAPLRPRYREELKIPSCCRAGHDYSIPFAALFLNTVVGRMYPSAVSAVFQRPWRMMP